MSAAAAVAAAAAAAAVAAAAVLASLAVAAVAAVVCGNFWIPRQVFTILPHPYTPPYIHVPCIFTHMYFH
jgi:hypothetical protein